MRRFRKIFSVRIRHEIDEWPDLSWLGEYSDQPKGKYYIDRKERGDQGRNELRYFSASRNYDGEKKKDAIKYMEQDYERMDAYNRGNWYMMGIRAEAEISVAGNVIQKISSGGLWGVESDAGADHLKEIEQEELNQLREQLRAIGFSDKYMDKAFERSDG
jgi:hypothetical protein